ncbi:MAG: GTPase ObgE [Candidatus Mcinerneyibacterium aminivorans]|uniref:GTPase Obg n=1 Tax=Candidatus Mcinerneyibacterium aminivorans TaxID=2703815 RepID=A0A5D0MFP2_9BACT|nr:MAG: GTPase ObgE [Candidatus Mcinerneyibacterium aminivorans]
MTMFIDEAKIYTQGGKGGPGCLSFRRQKYRPKGGPDGGKGGDGGNVYLVATKSVKTLFEIKNNPHFKAQSGEPGGPNNRYGKSGDDLIVYVPLGTTVYDDEGNLLTDLIEEKDEYLAAEGGRGGRGNKSFLSNTNRAPRIRELGEPGEKRTLHLELRLIADVGIVGFPNAGKSTLLSVLSNANPKIASYQFTTMEPQLGAIVSQKGYSFVIADLPGLIEGASDGVGLGDRFLKHVRRTRILLHLIDMAGIDGRKPWEDYYKIRKELEKFDKEVAKKEEIIVGNKFDIPRAEENYKKFKEKTGKDIIRISAVSHQNIDELKKKILKKINEIPEPDFKSRIDHHEIHRDKRYFTVEKEGDTFYVEGEYLKKTLEMTDFNLKESIKRATDIMKKLGVYKALREKGAKNGDSVIVSDKFNFIYMED